MPDRLRLEQLMRHAVGTGVTPALAVGGARGDAEPLRWFAGRHDPAPDAIRCSADSLFDLASLTKPLTTSIWALQLVERGLLGLTDPVGQHVEVSDRALAGCPLWRLLNHTSGLPAHREYYRGLGPALLRGGRLAQARQSLRRMLRATALESAPGQVERYSDLGFLLLELVCEAVDAPLSTRWRDLPLHGAHGLHFRPFEPGAPAEGSSPPAEQCAATEQCPWRHRMLRGEVHDDNAWCLGGIAGHAGLFATLDSVLSAGRAVLQLLRGEDARLGFSPELFAEATSVRWMHPQGTRVLGWDTPTPNTSTSGRHFSRQALGHLGFTGTSIWLDRAADLVIVVLSNRVCPSRDDARFRPLRPALHDAVWSCLHDSVSGDRVSRETLAPNE